MRFSESQGWNRRLAPERPGGEDDPLLDPMAAERAGYTPPHRSRDRLDVGRASGLRSW